MFEVAELKNAKQLHHFGRQLAVLKRIYQSYSLIIERLLSGPQPSRKTAAGFLISRKPSQSTGTDKIDPSGQQLSEPGPAYGAPLSIAAAVRFERLQDRISLYAMSEIQDCLDEKEALVMLVCRCSLRCICKH